MPTNVSVDTDVLATITETVLPLVPEEVAYVTFHTHDGDHLMFSSESDGKWKLREVG